MFSSCHQRLEDVGEPNVSTASTAARLQTNKLSEITSHHLRVGPERACHGESRGSGPSEEIIAWLKVQSPKSVLGTLGHRTVFLDSAACPE